MPRPDPTEASLSAPLAAALAHHAQGRMDLALGLLRRVVQKDPRHATANHLYALALAETGRAAEAEYFIRRAIASDPSRAPFHETLGRILDRKPDAAGAMGAYREAIRLEPGWPEPKNNLAVALMTAHRPGEAAALLEESLRLDPAQAEASSSLAMLMQHRAYGADLEEGGAGAGGVSCGLLRRALELRPGHPGLQSAYAFSLNYIDPPDPELALREHARYGELVGAALAPAVTHVTAPAPAPAPPPRRGRADEADRPLRVGYLSPDLRTHSVARFMGPILANHDRARVEACCYSSSPVRDEISDRLRGRAVVWRDVVGLNDARLAELIRRDRIDILVDLAGHTVGTRLSVLALRPAPVGVTYLGYPNTTGLPQVDYRIVDLITDPPAPPAPGADPLTPGGADVWATERLVRLDPCFLCYGPPEGAPEPGPPPSAVSGRVTFASFNFVRKIVPRVVDAWAAVLSAVPGSRLLLKSSGLDDPWVRDGLLAAFGRRGVDPGRVEAVGYAAGFAEHLRRYTAIDVGLDPFPYAGTTTTCEALWMGVPVVTRTGATHANRVGESLLRAVGLPELVARTDEEYVRLAAGLALDTERLSAVRAGLRERMRLSPLCDGPGFTRRLENAYRGMWGARVG